MSEYSFVEKPLLNQLAGINWAKILGSLFITNILHAVDKYSGADKLEWCSHQYPR